MSELPITAREFEMRLAVLCRGVDTRLPRKRRDRHIIFKSIVHGFEADREYSEALVNEVLKSWLTRVGTELNVDHVTLRRHLVDEGYLSRDHEGAVYRVHAAGRGAFDFDADVDHVDSAAVVRAARDAAARRKRDRTR